MVKNVNKNQEYNFVGLSKVIVARILDYLLISIVTFFISWVIYQSKHLTNLGMFLVNHITVLNCLLIYFVVIPYFGHGKTIAKMIFRFKLVKANSQKIRFFNLMYRELIITFVPWVILIISNLIMTLGFKYVVFNFKAQNFLVVKPQQGLPLAITIILRSVGLFYLGWYTILIILYKIEKNHQIWFDRYLKIYVVSESKKIRTSETDNSVFIEKNHIHLKENLPGNIDDKHLENIEDF